MNETIQVEFRSDGHLRIPASVALEHFKWDHVRLRIQPDSIVVMPTSPQAPDALLLKQRNLAGDRSVMLAEFLGDVPPVGMREAHWDNHLRSLVIQLS